MAGLVVLLVGTGGVLAGELAAGAADYGRYPETDGCAAPADSYPGGGLDPVLQRIALSALNGAACELRVSRERLVLALGDRAPAGTPRVDRPGMERALRSGLVRAVDDAERRGDVPGWTAGTLRYLARHAPVTWLTDRLGLPG